MKSFIVLLLGICISFITLGTSTQEKVSPNVTAVQNADSLKQNVGKDSADIGIGPVKTIAPGKLDSVMVQDGQSIFSSQCSDCHDINNDQDSGPSVKTFTSKRSPVFIMNYLLNTDEMNEKDPLIKQSINKYGNNPMPSAALTEQQARALLEYFRSTEKPAK